MHESPSITVSRRALIWPTYHFVCVPGIVGHHGTSVLCIFMQATVSLERPFYAAGHEPGG